MVVIQPKAQGPLVLEHENMSRGEREGRLIFPGVTLATYPIHMVRDVTELRIYLGRKNELSAVNGLVRTVYNGQIPILTET